MYSKNTDTYNLIMIQKNKYKLLSKDIKFNFESWVGDIPDFLILSEKEYREKQLEFIVQVKKIYANNVFLKLSNEFFKQKIVNNVSDNQIEQLNIWLKKHGKEKTYTKQSFLQEFYKVYSQNFYIIPLKNIISRIESCIKFDAESLLGMPEEDETLEDLKEYIAYEFDSENSHIMRNPEKALKVPHFIEFIKNSEENYISWKEFYLKRVLEVDSEIIEEKHGLFKKKVEVPYFFDFMPSTPLDLGYKELQKRKLLEGFSDSLFADKNHEVTEVWIFPYVFIGKTWLEHIKKSERNKTENFSLEYDVFNDEAMSTERMGSFTLDEYEKKIKPIIKNQLSILKQNFEKCLRMAFDRNLNKIPQDIIDKHDKNEVEKCWQVFKKHYHLQDLIKIMNDIDCYAKKEKNFQLPNKKNGKYILLVEVDSLNNDEMRKLKTAEETVQKKAFGITLILYGLLTILTLGIYGPAFAIYLYIYLTLKERKGAVLSQLITQYLNYKKTSLYLQVKQTSSFDIWKQQQIYLKMNFKVRK